MDLLSGPLTHRKTSTVCVAQHVLYAMTITEPAVSMPYQTWGGKTLSHVEGSLT